MTTTERDERFTVLPIEGWTRYMGDSSLSNLRERAIGALEPGRQCDVTREEKLAQGRRGDRAKAKVESARLSPIQRSLIRQLALDGQPRKSIAMALGVRDLVVGAVLADLSRKGVGA